MRLLAFDASTEALSVAFLDSDTGQAPDEIFDLAPREHARRLLPAAETLLARHGLTLTELDGLAFARGPGAFTGLRIAAGLVQGLAIGADLPVVGVSTLAAIARRALEAAPQATIAQVVQDARMGEIYTACFARDDLPEPLAAERVMSPADLGIRAGDQVVQAGNGWPLVEAAAHIVACVTSPHAADVAVLARRLFELGQSGPAESALPVYVRDDVARKPTSAR